MAKNEQVLEAFVGKTKAPKTKNLYVENGKLINYYTVIGQWHEELGLLINVTRYSQSTTTIRNRLIREAEYFGVKYIAVEEVPKGANDLVYYAKEQLRLAGLKALKEAETMTDDQLLEALSE